MRRYNLAGLVVVATAMAWSSGTRSTLTAQTAAPAQKWVATWAASVHGPYPSGNASAQPDLQFAIESPAAGFTDQTVRLMVRPDLWGSRIRLRFSNAFGTQPVTFDDVFVGLQAMGGSVAAKTQTRVAFSSQRGVTIAPGQSRFSDPVDLAFVRDPADPLLSGRRLAVSFHVVGSTGPMTWHAKALTTSYVSGPRTGSVSADEHDARLPFTTTSWYFVDAIDVMAPANTTVVACFGDSITDGTASTLNGDDRWPDALSRRLHATLAGRASVVNAGIGGNQVVWPPTYSSAQPVAGGPSALDRVERDVFGLSGLTSIVWLEGVNDLTRGASAEAVISGMRELVTRVHSRAGMRIIGATITSSLGATGASGTPEVDERRRAINTFIRSGGAFDGVADFDAVTLDVKTGALRAEFQPNSTTGGAGDKLHPNRAGYLAMGGSIDLSLIR
jgi:lysophospholipase L1-like esterase